LLLSLESVQHPGANIPVPAFQPSSRGQHPSFGVPSAAGTPRNTTAPILGRAVGTKPQITLPPNWWVVNGRTFAVSKWVFIMSPQIKKHQSIL